MDILSMVYNVYVIAVALAVAAILVSIPVCLILVGIRLFGQPPSGVRHGSFNRSVRRIGEDARSDMDRASREYLRRVAATRR